ncbi:MAG: DUF4136 domain-containing protein, partial [Weeksellaceae bacterium]
MRNLTTFLGIFLLLFITSCSSVRVSTDYDRNVSFDQFQTFSFHQKGLDQLNMNDLDKRRIVSAVTAELTHKGMKAASSENTADIIINLSAKKNTRVQVDADPWYNPWWGYG